MKDKLILVRAGGLGVLFAVGVALVILVSYLSEARPAQAAPSKRPLHRAHAALQSTAIFTDQYDGVDNFQTGFLVHPTVLSEFSCLNPFALVRNATFYRKIQGNTPLPNPAEDIDIYFFDLAPNFFYTISITATNIPTATLLFNVRLINPQGAQIGAASSAPGPVITFSVSTAAAGRHTLRMEAANANVLTETAGLLPYSVSLCSSPLPPPPPPGLTPDDYEPNNDPSQAANPYPNRRAASFIAVGTTINNLSFYPLREVDSIDRFDWFFVSLMPGLTYQVETSNVQPGVETLLEVFRSDPPAGDVLTSTRVPGQRGARLVFSTPPLSPLQPITYWIRVTNLDQSPRVPGQTYSLSVIEVVQPTATPGPTPTPVTPTPYPPGTDQFEYNGDFDFATLIAPGVKYGPLNFVPFQPPSPNTVDNDFFKLPVKQGVFYTCETLDLAPGVDTNIIVYNQDRVGIGGNDDISPEERLRGNFRSRFSWLSGYTGVAYILVGDVNPPRADQAAQRTYFLQCNIGIPETPTPTPAPATPTPVPPPVLPTPLPPEPEPTPFPTPRAAQNLVVRPAEPTPVASIAQPTPAPRVVQITVQVFNDLNRNGQLDPATGEGVRGVSVRLFDEVTGVPLAQALTDADGQARLSVETGNPVRVSVPMFAYSTVVAEPSAVLRLAVISRVPLPRRVG